MYDDFQAMAQGRCDYTISVIMSETPEYGPMMTLCATEEAVYVTKEQAMAFSGLVELEKAS